MTSRTRAASGRIGRKIGSALSALALLAATTSVPSGSAHAQDGPSLIRDTEIEQDLKLRVVPLTQTTVFSNQGGYYPEVVEGRFDRVYMGLQQLQ